MIVVGALMAIVLILRPTGLTGGREFQLWPRASVMTRVCVAGAGVIGSLFAAHLARVAEVSALVRREEHARALREQGLRVSGRADFTAQLQAATVAGGAARARARDRRLQGHSTSTQSPDGSPATGRTRS